MTTKKVKADRCVTMLKALADEHRWDIVRTLRAESLSVSQLGAPRAIGIATRQVQWKPVLGVLASWVVTLPCAALLAAAVYWLTGAR